MHNFTGEEKKENILYKKLKKFVSCTQGIGWGDYQLQLCFFTNYLMHDITD